MATAKKATAPKAAKTAKPAKAATPAPAHDRVAEGDAAPAIELANDEGAAFSLSSLQGKIVVLYFYPKADTSGCTKESIAFRDAAADFKKSGAVIVGISPDGVAAQKKFKTKYALTFPLLADVDHAVAEAYGVWAEKSMYGRTYFGIERSTFVIAADGTLAGVYRKVKVDGHAEHVLEAVRALKTKK